MCPLEKGVRGIETSESGYLREQIRGGRKGRTECQGLGQSPNKTTRHLQMPGRSWQAGKTSGDGKPAGPDRPLEKGVGGIEINGLCR